MSKQWTILLCARLVREGWEVRQKNHYVAKCPCGRHTMTWPKSASDHRAEKNAASMLRRIEAEHALSTDDSPADV